MDQERDLFGRFHIFPIFVPRGEQVGNSYDSDTYPLITNKEDCFPKLQIRQDFGQLPSMFTNSEQGLAAALGAAGVGEAEAGQSGKRAYSLSFTDVDVQTASVVGFRTAIPKGAPQECLDIRPYLQAFTTAPVSAAKTAIGNGSPRKTAAGKIASVTIQTSQAKVPILIGSVFRARRILRVKLYDQAEAKAQVSIGESLLRRVGLGSAFKLRAGAAATQSDTIEFVGETIVPVAYAPAFELIETTKSVDGRTNTVTLAETNPAEIREKVAAVEMFLSKYEFIAVSRIEISPTVRPFSTGNAIGIGPSEAIVARVRPHRRQHKRPHRRQHKRESANQMPLATGRQHKRESTNHKAASNRRRRGAKLLAQVLVLLCGASHARSLWSFCESLRASLNATWPA
jgi:hypothetical protein